MQISVDIIKDNLDTVQALASIVQTIVSALAIIIGGFWVYVTFILKRERLPRASIQHQVRCRYLTRKRILLTIFVIISNDGNVLLPIKIGEMRVQQIFPLPEELLTLINTEEDILDILNSLQKEKKKEESQTGVAWPLIGIREPKWRRGLEIEPGNSMQIPFDFTISSEVQTVRITSFFPNVAKRKCVINWRNNHPRWILWKKEPRAIGWWTVTDHDLTLRPSNQKT